MATMLSGAAVMDGAILVIAANEKCPQPQTREHLAAIQAVGLDKLIIVQNKIDLVTVEEAEQSYKDIKKFLKESIAEDAPIIPVSAQQVVNVDLLIQAMQEYLPTPERDPDQSPRMYIVRSFDVNKPGTKIPELVGGILGGSLLRGKIKVGDVLEVRPGIGNQPVQITVTSLLAGKKKYKELVPGGLAGIGTNSDPSIMKSDNFKGMVIGTPESLPDIVNKITLEINLLKRIVGSKKDLAVEQIRTGVPLMLTIGTTNTVGVVTSERKSVAEVALKMAVCAFKEQRVAISRMVENRWHLVGYGVIKDIVPLE